MIIVSSMHALDQSLSSVLAPGETTTPPSSLRIWLNIIFSYYTCSLTLSFSIFPFVRLLSFLTTTTAIHVYTYTRAHTHIYLQKTSSTAIK